MAGNPYNTPGQGGGMGGMGTPGQQQGAMVNPRMMGGARMQYPGDGQMAGYQNIGVSAQTRMMAPGSMVRGQYNSNMGSPAGAMGSPGNMMMGARVPAVTSMDTSAPAVPSAPVVRSEEHTSELQSQSTISYAVF